MQTSRNSNLESFNEVLQFVCLGLAIGDLLFKQLEVPDLSVDRRLWAVFHSLRRMALRQCTYDYTLSLNHCLEGNFLEQAVIHRSVVLRDSLQCHLVGKVDDGFYQKLEVAFVCPMLSLLLCRQIRSQQTHRVLQDGQDIGILGHQLTNNIFPNDKGAFRVVFATRHTQLNSLLLQILRQFVC